MGEKKFEDHKQGSLTNYGSYLIKKRESLSSLMSREREREREGRREREGKKKEEKKNFRHKKIL